MKAFFFEHSWVLVGNGIVTFFNLLAIVEFYDGLQNILKKCETDFDNT